jgi:hypothetical protein
MNFHASNNKFHYKIFSLHRAQNFFGIISGRDRLISHGKVSPRSGIGAESMHPRSEFLQSQIERIGPTYDNHLIKKKELKALVAIRHVRRAFVVDDFKANSA